MLLHGHAYLPSCSKESRQIRSQHRPASAVSRNVVVRSSNHDADVDDEDDETPVAGKAMRIERLLSNLGYGKRKDCQLLVKKGRVLGKDGQRLRIGDKVFHDDLTLDGEPLDPAFPLNLALYKPVGYVVTSPEDEKIQDPKIYDLLPFRYGSRKPFLSAIGRLDKDTSGLLLMTDDGQLVHKVKSPKQGIWKVYEAKLSAPLTPSLVATARKRFATGTMVLQGDTQALLPAALTMIDEQTARLCICEGRYHQVRRMFLALGHEVVALHRPQIGGLTIQDMGLSRSQFCALTQEHIDKVFGGPTTDEVMSTVAKASAAGIMRPQQPAQQQPATEGIKQEVTQAPSSVTAHEAGSPSSARGEQQRQADAQDAGSDSPDSRHDHDDDESGVSPEDQIAARQEQQVANLATSVKSYKVAEKKIRRRLTARRNLPAGI